MCEAFFHLNLKFTYLEVFLSLFRPYCKDYQCQNEQGGMSSFYSKPCVVPDGSIPIVECGLKSESGEGGGRGGDKEG